MGDSENAQQTSKKRGAVKELSRDNPGLDDEEDIAQFESGTFKKASDEVLANRRIVKVKRKEPPSAVPAAATPNPFAGIQLVPASTAPAPTTVVTNPPLAEPKVTSAEAVVEENQKESDEEGDEVDSKKVDVKDSSEKETVKTKDEDDKTVSGVANISNAPEGIDSAKEETEKTKHEDDKQVSVADDKAVSGVTNISNAPEGTDETADPLERGSGGDQTERTEKEGGENKEGDNNGGLSSFQQHSSNKNAFTGLATTETSASPFSFSSISQDPSTNSGSSLFGFALPNTSIFGSSITNKTEANPFPPKQEVSTETGEENEKLAFSTDSVLFEYLEGGWKERGKGEVKVNVSSKDGKARLVMRAKGNYRLILNASLYPEMKLASMDKKGITFACVNSIISEEEEGKKVGLSTFALKFKDPLIVGEFRVAIDKHKALLPLETPENSPTDA